MTTQLLASELTNLIQESKRKHNDLRVAAEKSLEELKTVKASNEAQAAAELSQRPNFVNPFIIACGTKNVKFTGIAIVCLQRLIVARALPRTKLDQALEALREATSAGLDVQLKILQALPSLLQNYATDLRGDLLITTLNICFVLQTSKNAIVNNTSAATLQQLVVSVFDKVVAEDKAGNAPPAGEAPTSDGTAELRPAALDAYRVFNDLCLMTESQRPEYLRFSGLPQTFGLELIESVLTNHTSIFLNHPEQTHILRVRVMPFIIGALRGKPNFATTVRLVRILYTLLRRHLNVLTAEGADALDILTHLLDQDTALWRRALCMEVFRGVFSEHALVRRIYALYDAREGEIPILKNLTATFVRLSTEKPAVIGLGPQSSIPVSNPYGNAGAAADHVMLDSSGVTGIITTGASEGSSTGISAQWSHVRVPCIDQLDKTEPPSIPESYIYSLALSCISSFSEGLAKFILPLTVPAEGRNRKRNTKLEGGRDSPAPSAEGSPHPLGPRGQLERAGSFKKNPVPRNPLSLEDHPLYVEVKICAAIVEECWPAFLATCSTFLYAALDSEYYHGLVRAFQRFAHVAGLLQLTTPRDAFLTTLGKAAVPPNVITACLNVGTGRPQNTEPTVSANSILSNAKGLLSVDSLVAPGSSASDRGRQPSLDTSGATLTTRNLLCLRALLNLGIALGPTLHTSWRIILETLQQADFVLFTTHKTPGRTPTVSRSSDQAAENEANTLLSNFSAETRAVETAASRLIESTVDFPNDAFVQVVEALCELLGRKRDHKDEKQDDGGHALSPTGTGALKAPANQHARSSSVSVSATAPNQENQFALAKLGDLATINIERLLSYDPEESGWDVLTTELIRTLNSQSANASVRLRAADILVSLALESANVAGTLEEEERGSVQLQVLEALRDALLPLQSEDREVSVATHSTDVDIHKAILDGVKNLLENCGETLVSGWDVAFQIIGSIFLQKHVAPEDRKDGDVQSTALVTRSAKLVRSSFSSLQLICSDFLASLPNSCFLILVDTLYKFCSQDDDLNIALTTVTFFWVLSDFLSGQNKTMSITSDLMRGAGVSDLVAKASQPGGAGANAALWMLLLLRLTTVTNDDRLELRNSAIQTLLRIFDAYGDNLDPEAWYTCVKHVVFRLLSSIEEELEDVESDPEDEDRKEWHGTSVIVLNGISELLAAYLEVLSKHASFNELWRELLEHFTTLLNFKALDINTALFKALGKVVSPEQHASRAIFDQETVESAWRLWSSGIPVPEDADDAADNQNCLIAYVGAFDDVYRLVSADLTVDKVRQILTLFREALRTATVGAYVNDAEYATPLQTRVLDAIKKIRTDLKGVPAVMMTQVAELVRLPFPEDPAQAREPPTKRTFVALSRGSMAILQELVLANASDADIYASSALAAALSSLARPIKLKYRFPVVTKTPPWQVATHTALAILDAVLPHLHGPEVPRATIQRIWELIVETADGIITAEWEAAPAAGSVASDQAFDLNAFRRLRDLIMPGLGSEVIPDKTRKAYAESLFRTSIIYRPSPGEMSLIYGHGGSEGAGLSALYKARAGRTTEPEPTARDKMSYACLDELFSLVAAYDEPSGPTIVVQPPTPRFPVAAGHGAGGGGPGVPSENPQALHVRTARAAAPFLIFRAALPLRSYVADQPLRGRMPQPLGQRQELVRVLHKLVDLRSQAEAIPDTATVDSEGRKHLLRLYPLLVGTVRVAGASGDDGVLRIATEALEVVGGEFGI